MRVGTVLSLSVLICATGSAQQSTCTVPVTVVAPALSERQKLALDLMTTPETRDLPWEVPYYLKFLSAQIDAAPVVVPDLEANAFIVEEARGPVTVQSVKTVGGPRRIVFVVENRGEMPATAQQIEAAVIADILSKARKEDSFALLTARGPRVALGFASSREAIGAAAQALANAPGGESDGQSALAAVLEATTWLKPSQPGDSVFLLVLGLDKSSVVSLPKVRAAVAEAGVRVLGFELARAFTSGMSAGDDYDPVLNYERDIEFGGWTNGSGANTQRGKQYHLAPERLDPLKQLGEEMYQAITDPYYLLQLDSTSPPLSISLAPVVLLQFPWVSLSYPRYLPKCAESGLAQPPPCEVPVRVTAPDLSTLPQNVADAAVVRWKQVLSASDFETLRAGWPQGRGFSQPMNLQEGLAPIKLGIVDDLETDAFVAHDKQHPLAIRSASTDQGPHRIIFVVDNGKKIKTAARKAEAAIISNILLKARAEDSFALLTAHGPRRELRFGASRDSLRRAAEQFAAPSREKSRGKPMLDTILEATAWFQPPQPGDSIFALGGTFDSSLGVTSHKLRAALEPGRVRMFWIQVAAGGPASYQAAKLAAESGGWAASQWVFMRRETLEQQLAGLVNDSEEMYMEVTKHYLLKLDSFGPDLTIELAPSVKAQYPWAKVHFPQFLPACTATSAKGARTDTSR